MMAEYIEREAARKLACKICGECDGGVDVCQFRDIDVDAIPAADVRPVVLCRDCKHSAVDFENMRYCKCVTYYNHVQDDWFCSDGEKREES